jgi:hypothetical protein
LILWYYIVFLSFENILFILKFEIHCGLGTVF